MASPDPTPVCTVPNGKTPRPVTIIYPYFENPKFFAFQLYFWMISFQGKINDHLSFIVVDDGSPRDPAEAVIAKHIKKWGRRFKLRLFRIEQNVRWNWLAARNIGWHHAPDGWCAVTDMDHVIPPPTMEGIVFGEHDPGTIYRFSRREHDGKDNIHPHPNSWFMTREMYWKVGGYDESLSGFYGTDGDWRRRCAETAPVRILTDVLVRHEYVGDSSTTDYKRKQAEDAGKKAIIRARGKGWRPKVLSYAYHEVIGV